MSSSPDFRHLLSSGSIGSMALRNRIAMTPMGSNLAEPDGIAGERIQRYYEERARGGAGLLIVGVGAIAHPIGTCNPNQVGISDDRFLPGLQALTDRVHAHGAKVAIQLQHAGKVATRDIVAGRPLWVPSTMRYEAGDLMDALSPEELAAVTGDFRKPGAKMSYHEMTLAEIATLVGWFVEAADRAKRAGFDGVELHAGHGYILSSFLSPHTNRRTDAYGGSLQNRARLFLEVVSGIRDALGRKFPLWCRLDSKEFRVPDGITLDDALRTAQMGEAAGLDAIHVSAYADPSSGVAFTDAPLVHEPCGFVPLAETIKKGVSIPVIAVGRIEPEDADELIASGRADFIAMGRKLLADPDLPRKLGEGRREDVRPCIYCYKCVGEVFLNRPVCCAVNPATGREAEFDWTPSPSPRHVLVVGGGPAGMEAARIAALRGHRVTLCEKADRLGGTAVFSSLVYEPNGRLVSWLEAQIRELPVEVRLRLEATPEWVRELRPDVALVAVGARREASTIPGARERHVLDGDDLRAFMTGDDPEVAREKLSLVQRGMVGVGEILGLARRTELARELTRTWMPLGDEVAIIGGGLVGLELAEFLADRGRRVTVFEESPYLGLELAPPRRWRILHDLREHSVVLRTETTVERITERAVVARDASGQELAVAADSVILAGGASSNDALADALRAVCAEVHVLGDCGGVGYIPGAMLDAARVAGEI